METANIIGNTPRRIYLHRYMGALTAIHLSSYYSLGILYRNSSLPISIKITPAINATMNTILMVSKWADFLSLKGHILKAYYCNRYSGNYAGKDNQ